MGLWLESLLGFERSLQAIRPVAILDDATGELVDDRNAAVPDDVIDVAEQQCTRVQRAVELGQQPVIVIAVQAAARKGPLDVLDARLNDRESVLRGIQ